MVLLVQINWCSYGSGFIKTLWLHSNVVRVEPCKVNLSQFQIPSSVRHHPSVRFTALGNFVNTFYNFMIFLIEAN